METETESTLQEYQIQLEQVEIALRSQPDNEELLKLKEDLIEVITITKELIAEEANDEKSSKYHKKSANVSWKEGDKCMAIWRIDGKYYSASVKQILDDGSCTVVFDGHSSVELAQVGQLMPRNKNSNILSNDSLIQNNKTNTSSSQVGHKKAFTKKELELKLREARKRKKEKLALKLKAMDELSEKEKNKWKSFNSKLAGKTWKGVVKKNKFDLPDDHENKIGVGTNSLTNRSVSASGIVLPTNTNSSASAAATSLSSSTKARHSAHSYKTSTFK